MLHPRGIGKHTRPCVEVNPILRSEQGPRLVDAHDEVIRRAKSLPNGASLAGVTPVRCDIVMATGDGVRGHLTGTTSKTRPASRARTNVIRGTTPINAGYMMYMLLLPPATVTTAAISRYNTWWLAWALQFAKRMSQRETSTSKKVMFLVDAMIFMAP